MFSNPKMAPVNESNTTTAYWRIVTIFGELVASTNNILAGVDVTPDSAVGDASIAISTTTTTTTTLTTAVSKWIIFII